MNETLTKILPLVHTYLLRHMMIHANNDRTTLDLEQQEMRHMYSNITVHAPV